MMMTSSSHGVEEREEMDGCRQRDERRIWKRDAKAEIFSNTLFVTITGGWSLPFTLTAPSAFHMAYYGEG